MNRPILVGMIGLALAGCAQTRPAIPLSRNGSRMPPVGLPTLPNIYEAVNRDNPRIDPAALHPENGPVLAHLDGNHPSGAQGGPGAAPAADGHCQECLQANAGGPNSNPSVPLEYSGPPAVAAAAAPAPAPAPELEPVMPAPAAEALPEPAVAAEPTAAPAHPEAPEILQTTGGPRAAEAPVLPAAPDQPEPPVEPGPEPVIAPAPATAPEPAPAAAPPAVPLEHPPEPAPAPAPDPAPAMAQPASPLDLPPIPDLPPAEAPTTGSNPAPGPVPVADPAPAESPSPSPSPVPPANPEAVAVPNTPESPLDLPPLPPLEAIDPPKPAEGPQAAAQSSTQAKIDPAVMTVAADPAAIQTEASPLDMKEAAQFAAQVGDEVITVHELKTAVKEKVASLPGGYTPNRQEIMMITSQVLDMLIERSMIVQEAKREMKKPEVIQMFMKKAEGYWREEELPPLLKSMAAMNEYELKQKLAEQGKSLDAMIETFKLDFLARGFMEQKLRPKITVDVPEMRAYYNEHLHDFDRPAQWTWREIIVEADKHASRAEARAKAESALGRLRRGEDFAQVARSESEGPTRTDGGLWETTPGSYAVAAVNEALGTLPIGQVSPIIEGPTSYHIVRVETRRPAGPAPFPEVQDKVRTVIHQQKVRQESMAFLNKLRQQTVVSTIFDRSDYAPAATRTTTASAR